MTRAPDRSDSIDPSAPGKHPRQARVRHRREFLRIQRRGVRVHTPAFTVIALAGHEGRARLGCAVSKRVGNAVLRTRVRRLLKEIFRRLARSLPPVDVVVVAKPPAAELAKKGLVAMAQIVGPAIGNAAKKAAGLRDG